MNKYLHINNFIIKSATMNNWLSISRPRKYLLFLNLFHFIFRIAHTPFSIIILTHFPLNLVSYTQQVSTTYNSISIETLLNYHWASTIMVQANLDFRWCHCWITIWWFLYFTLVLQCVAPTFWRVPIQFTWFFI